MFCCNRVRATGLGQAGKVVDPHRRKHAWPTIAATGKPAERKQKVDELMEVFARYGMPGQESVA